MKKKCSFINYHVLVYMLNVKGNVVQKRDVNQLLSGCRQLHDHPTPSPQTPQPRPHHHPATHPPCSLHNMQLHPPCGNNDKHLL